MNSQIGGNILSLREDLPPKNGNKFTELEEWRNYKKKMPKKDACKHLTLTLEEAIVDSEINVNARLGLEKAFTALCSVLEPGAKNPPVVGRVKEAGLIDEFVRKAVEGSPSACMLYISGIPGTGKTTLVNHKLEKYSQGNSGFVKCYINGLEIGNPLDCFSRIWKSLRTCLRHPPEEIERAAPSKALTYIRKYIEEQQGWEHGLKKKLKKPPPEPFEKKLIVVLDEMDVAVGASGATVLFDIFDMLGRTNVFTFIGIANRQNLFESFKFTEKHTMRLGSRTEKFQRIVFGFYSTQDLLEIVIARLKGVLINAYNREKTKKLTIRGIDLIESNAVQIGMMKVQKYADGDCREALHILKYCFFDKSQLVMSLADTVSLVRTGSHVVSLGDVQACTKDTYGPGAAAKVSCLECLCLVIVAYESNKRDTGKLDHPIRKEQIVQRYQVLVPHLTPTPISPDYQTYLTTPLTPGEQQPPPPIALPSTSPSPLFLAHDCMQHLRSLITLGHLTDRGVYVSLSHTIDNVHLKSMLEAGKELSDLRIVKELKLNDVGY